MKKMSIRKIWFYFRRGDNVYLRFVAFVVTGVSVIYQNNVLSGDELIGIKLISLFPTLLTFFSYAIVIYMVLGFTLGYLDIRFNQIGVDMGIYDEKNPAIMKIHEDLKMIKDKLGIKDKENE